MTMSGTTSNENGQERSSMVRDVYGTRPIVSVMFEGDGRTGHRSSLRNHFRRRRMILRIIVVAAAVLSCAISIPLCAANGVVINSQIVGPMGKAPLNNAPQSITIAMNGGLFINFNLASGQTAAGSAPVAWTTSWTLDPTATPTLKSYVYFSNSSALTGLSSSANTIDSSHILGQPDQSGPYVPINGNVNGQINALLVSTTSITSSTGSRADSLALEISTAGITVKPDTYRGTLYIISVAGLP
jgi:hypothetical protein